MKKELKRFHWIAVFIFICTMMFCLAFGFQVSADEYHQITSTDQIEDVSAKTEDQIVILYKESDENNIQKLNIAENQISGATSLSNTVDIVSVPEEQDGDAFIDKLEENRHVAHAFWNVSLKTNTLPDDPLLADYGYYYSNSQIDETWDITGSNSQEVVVAVIDSGVNAIAEDFEGRIYPVQDMYTPADPQNDLAGHGTMVASNIVSLVNNGIGLAGSSGLANVKVLPYRIGGDYNNDSNLSFASFLAAVDDILQNHPEVKVVNMSFGMEISKSEIAGKSRDIAFFQEIMDQLYEAGIIVVSSAGNSGKYYYNYPACCEHVLCVASVDYDMCKSSFSTYNEYVDIAAVGKNVPVATKDGDYGFASGTSFSSPIVAGACAFLLSTTGKTSEEVTNAVYQTASHAELGRDDETGNGVIQVKDAFESLAGDIDFSLHMEECESYYVDDEILISAEDENDLTYEFVVNGESIPNIDGQAKYVISKPGENLIEITGILPCGANQTKTFRFNAKEDKGWTYARLIQLSELSSGENNDIDFFWFVRHNPPDDIPVDSMVVYAYDEEKDEYNVTYIEENMAGPFWGLTFENQTPQMLQEKLDGGSTVYYICQLDCPYYGKGDVNGDACINILDARLAKRIALKAAQDYEYSKKGLNAGDFDGNGKITINEARKIKRAVLKEVSLD